MNNNLTLIYQYAIWFVLAAIHTKFEGLFIASQVLFSIFILGNLIQSRNRVSSER